MKNISFDNPYLLLLAIPLSLAVIIPFFVCRSKDNRGKAWTASLAIHLVIILLSSLAAAGLSSVTVMTKTTVYVVADVSHSSERNLDRIDAYIAEIKEELPENATLGVVCFAKNSTLLTPAGRTLKSVREAELDTSATDIVAALDYTESLFAADTINRVVLITDGNDTMPQNQSKDTLAATVERMVGNGIKVDAIFLDNTLGEDDTEVQLMEADLAPSTYIGRENEAKFLIQASRQTEVRLTLFGKEQGTVGDMRQLGSTVVTADAGLSTVRMSIPNDRAASFEYRVTVDATGDLSAVNNTRIFTQTVIGERRILFLSGRTEELSLLENADQGDAEIDAYLVASKNTDVPFLLEDLLLYDEFIISNLDIRNIHNANAFIDSLEKVLSQYGKSLTVLGNLYLHTNAEDPILRKFEELLPVSYGSTNRDGRMYTIVLDISHSMFSASKFTTAKNAAIQLLSTFEKEDYVTLVTFSGNATKVWGPKQIKNGKEDLVTQIGSIQETEHGTDIGKGLEAALAAVHDLKLADNRIIVISDGVIHRDVLASTLVEAEKLRAAGATVTSLHTYIMADGGVYEMEQIAKAGGGTYFPVERPSDVDKVVFGQMAETLTEALIEKDAPVNIARYRDDIVDGITALPAVSSYVLSLAKYDATVPLTVTHVRENGYQETVPLYAYRAHGNGRVAAFTSSLSGDWITHWSEADTSALLSNLIVSNTPTERIDRPFTLSLMRNDYQADIEIVPAILDPDAKVTLSLTSPSGNTIRRTLAFDSQKYSYQINTPAAGTYRIQVTYAYGDRSYTAETAFSIPYLPEYDAFASFDRYHVYEFMREFGRITEDGIPNLENDKNELTTYKLSYTVPLLFAAIVLFGLDILIRKLRISRKKAGHGAPKKGADA